MRLSHQIDKEGRRCMLMTPVTPEEQARMDKAVAQFEGRDIPFDIGNINDFNKKGK